MKKCDKCGVMYPEEYTICPKCNGMGNVETIKTRYAKFRVLSIISVLFGGIFWCIGFYKLLAYDSGEYEPYTTTNAYVGGDAYNFIINASYFTAFAVMGGTCFICGALFYCYYHHKTSTE